MKHTNTGRWSFLSADHVITAVPTAACSGVNVCPINEVSGLNIFSNDIALGPNTFLIV